MSIRSCETTADFVDELKNILAADHTKCTQRLILFINV